MNRARKLVLFAGSAILLYLIIQFYFFGACPVGYMCSANKIELTSKMLLAIAGTGVAWWLLKPEEKQPNSNEQDPPPPASE